jgi:cyclohexyl-isocyanide hydratase
MVVAASCKQSIARGRPALEIGTLLFEKIDQIDVTGPFEVLARIPGARHRFYGLNDQPIRDIMGLQLMPDAAIKDCPQLDVLHVPGGPGQEAVMDDEELHAWLRAQSQGATKVFSVCTGALVLGGAGLLQGRRATTHWASHHLLPLFGATAIDARVVNDGKFLFAAGVTAGIDGALALAAELCGDHVAQQIQLEIAYAPEPPFNSGTPDLAPAPVLAASRAAGAELLKRRGETARRYAKRFGLADHVIRPDL